MSENKTNQKKGRILFRLLKGFVYGAVIGLFSGSALYLLCEAVNAIAQLPVSSSAIFGLIFGASVVAGVAHEYSKWLEQQGVE